MMNKNAAPFLVTLLVAIGMLGVWMVTNGLSSGSTQEIASIREDQFGDEVIKAKETVLVDFYADWCVPCRQQGSILMRYSQKDNPPKIVKIDVERNRKLAAQYKVEAIPTLLVFKNGELVNRHEGLATAKVLDALTK